MKFKSLNVTVNGVVVNMICALDKRSIASGAAPYPPPQDYIGRSTASSLASKSSVIIALALIARRKMAR